MSMDNKNEDQDTLNKKLFRVCKTNLRPKDQSAIANLINETEKLLADGANILVSDQNGRTPLHYAAWQVLPEIIDLLLTYALNKGQLKEMIEAQTPGGWTALHQIAGTDRSSDFESIDRTVQLLIEHGANINHKTTGASEQRNIQKSPAQLAINTNKNEVKKSIENPSIAWLEKAKWIGELDKKNKKLIKAVTEKDQEINELKLKLQNEISNNEHLTKELELRNLQINKQQTANKIPNTTWLILNTKRYQHFPPRFGDVQRSPDTSDPNTSTTEQTNQSQQMQNS